MTIAPEIIVQLLTRPPKLLSDGSGYDWREFDRWMQRIWKLLGAPQNAESFNIPREASPSQSSIAATGLDVDFATDKSLEIQMLRQRVDQLAIEISMIADSSQDIANIRNQISDIYTELGGLS